VRIPPNIPVTTIKITVPLISSTKASGNIDKNSFINYLDDGKPYLMPDKDCDN